MTTTRQLPNWLSAYGEYTTRMAIEPPELFNAWCGMSTIAAALERKVWYTMVHVDIFPNMSVVLVAPPGAVRKGAALGAAHKLLNSVRKNINMSKNRLNAAVLIRDLSNALTVFQTDDPRFPIYTHSTITAFADELGNFLRSGDKDLLTILNDFIDSFRDEWVNETIGRGEESIKGPCLNILAGTVPPGYSNSIPPEVVSSGFSARSIFLYTVEKACSNIIEVVDDPQILVLRRKLVHDLRIINKMYGKYKLTPAAQDYLVTWYKKHDTQLKEMYVSGNLKPEFVMTFLARQHTHVMKVAMVLAASTRNDLSLEQSDIEAAVRLVKMVEPMLYKVFAGTGKALDAADTTRIIEQIEKNKVITRSELLFLNQAHVNINEFKLVIEKIVAMGLIKKGVRKGQEVYIWKGVKK